MKRQQLEIIIPLLLSIMVIFFLIKQEDPISNDKTPLFKINKNKETADNVEENITEDTAFSNLKSKIEKEQGTYSLYIKDIKNNKTYQLNPEEQYYPLSLFKVAIAYIVARDVEKGDLNWEDKIEYTRSDYYDNFGTIASSGFGSEFTIKKIVELMLRESDNAAPIMLKNYLGEDYLNDEFKKITGDKNSDLFDEYLTTTVIKCSRLLEGIFYKKWISDENVNLLLSYMYPTSYDTTITPHLNSDLTFYHKVGIMPGLYHNCGVVRGENKDLLLCLLSKDITEESFDNVSRYVAEFVNGL